MADIAAVVCLFAEAAGWPVSGSLVVVVVSTFCSSVANSVVEEGAPSSLAVVTICFCFLKASVLLINDTITVDS